MCMPPANFRCSRTIYFCISHTPSSSASTIVLSSRRVPQAVAARPLAAKAARYLQPCLRGYSDRALAA